MRKFVTCLAVFLLCILTAASAMAEVSYIFPESDSRLLTWQEIDQWDYETLGYAYNEIFARHGYDFNPGGEYEYYFSTRVWYRPNGTGTDSRHQPDCYPYVNSVEWQNCHLIKEVRASKKYADYGKSIWDYFSTGFDTLQGFEYVTLRSGQKLAVYSAPSTSSWRGANGKASVSTNGVVYAAGWESGWLMVMYETNSGSVRVGYVSAGSIRGGVPMDTSLDFAYDSATVTARCTLTDDPARTGTSMATLPVGTRVTFLSRFYNNSAWDYVETTVNGKTARGFIRTGSLDISRSADPLENLDYGK